MRLIITTGIVVSVFTILAIYLTPLKNLNIVEPAVRDIDPKEFYQKFKENPDKYIFVDVRGNSLYKKIHAEGSINIELHKMYTEKHNLPKRGKEIVLICSGGFASGVAYGYLEHHGFLNLLRIEGGIENWESRGLPIITEKIL